MFFLDARVPTAKSIPKTHITHITHISCKYPYKRLTLRIVSKFYTPRAWGKSSSTTRAKAWLATVTGESACGTRPAGWGTMPSKGASRAVALPIPTAISRGLTQRGDDQEQRRRIGPFPVATVRDAYENHIRVEVEAFQTHVHHVILDLDKRLKLGCTLQHKHAKKLPDWHWVQHSSSWIFRISHQRINQYQLETYWNMSSCWTSISTTHIRNQYHTNIINPRGHPFFGQAQVPAVPPRSRSTEAVGNNSHILLFAFSWK